MNEGDVVEVVDLKRIKGGYEGWGNGKKIFLPLSQTRLNITSPFNPDEPVEVIIIEAGKRPVGSRKSLLQKIGRSWIESLQEKDLNRLYKGRVTGVLHSRKYCGVFIELEEAPVTGFLPERPRSLVDYKVGEEVVIRIDKVDGGRLVLKKRIPSRLEDPL